MDQSERALYRSYIITLKKEHEKILRTPFTVCLYLNWLSRYWGFCTFYHWQDDDVILFAWVWAEIQNNIMHISRNISQTWSNLGHLMSTTKHTCLSWLWRYHGNHIVFRHLNLFWEKYFYFLIRNSVTLTALVSSAQIMVIITSLTDFRTFLCNFRRTTLKGLNNAKGLEPRRLPW